MGAETDVSKEENLAIQYEEEARFVAVHSPN
jgi:hypothetical protein